MTFKQSILELQHCNKCNSDMSFPDFGGLYYPRKS